MGGQPYYYFVPYEKDVQHALETLRTREFAAGRYSPVMRHIKFDETVFLSQKPGAKHASIDEALDASAEEGTRSILDVSRVAHDPDFGVAAPFAPNDLRRDLGTAQPSRAELDAALFTLFAKVPRGQCRYLVLYDGDRPTEIFFVGCSYD